MIQLQFTRRTILLSPIGRWTVFNTQNIDSANNSTKMIIYEQTVAIIIKRRVKQ